MCTASRPPTAILLHTQAPSTGRPAERMRGIIAHCAPWICAPLFEQRLVVFLLRDLAALVPLVNTLSMAVRQGFEPWVPFKGYNALAKRRFRPLSHLTMLFIFLQRARNLIADSRSGKRFSPACCAGEAKKGSRRASKIGECWIPQHARVVFLAVRRGWQANLKIQRGSRVRWREEPRLAAHRERQCRSWRAA